MGEFNFEPADFVPFKDKEVLECGCGCGQHTSFMSPYARSIIAVDLNTTEIAIERNKNADNVEFLSNDIADMELGKEFDIVISIGVVHHTDDPDKTVHNLIRHVKPGGKLILWVYSQEGNVLVRYLVEPFRKIILRKVNRRYLLLFSKIITLTLYLPIFSIYLLPLRILPYYEYFENFRRLSFYRNTLNVFDKLNAPQVDFISKSRAKRWVAEHSDVHVNNYKNVSWRISATIH